MPEPRIVWDNGALLEFEYVVSEQVLELASADVFDAAVAIAPMGPAWGQVGRLKASLWRDVRPGYADVGAEFYGRFLDPKARQIRRLHPFLPSALDVLNGKEYR